MPFATGSTNTAVINGEIYVAGGAVKYPAYGPVSGVAKYNPATNSWTTLASMPSGRHKRRLGTDGQKLYVRRPRRGARGLQRHRHGADLRPRHERLDHRAANAASGVPNMPRNVRGTSRAVFYGGEFWIFGGETSYATDPDATSDLVFKRVEVYDPQRRPAAAGPT